MLQLHDEYSYAKELGELVARKRQSVAELKRRVAAADGSVDAEDLRAQLLLDTATYKDSVQSLKEIKVQIESFHAQLAESQQRLSADFEKWYREACRRELAQNW